MTTAMALQKEAVACGYWPLYHYDPRDEAQPFHLDSKKPKGDYKDFAMQQARFAMLTRSKPEEAERLFKLAQEDIDDRWHAYEQLAVLQREETTPADDSGVPTGGDGADKAKTTEVKA